MHYIVLVLIAMVGYGVMATLLKLSMRTIPPESAVFITNVMLVLIALAWGLHRGVRLLDSLALDQPTLLLFLSGIVLSISVICFYTALSRGPITVVLPLYGMNIAIATLLGVLVLGEPMTLPRASGLVMAGGAIFLLTR